MKTLQRVRRPVSAVVAALSLSAAALALVPADAQDPPPPGVTPYLELMTGFTSATQYVRYVDGVETTADPQQGFTSLAPWVLNEAPELLTVAAAADPQTVLAGTGCLDGGGNPIGPLPPVVPTHYTQPPVGWITALPLIGVKSYKCDTGGSAIIAESDTAVINAGETLTLSPGSATPFDFGALKLSILTSNTSEVRVTAKRDGEVVGTIDVDVDVDCVESTDWENEDVLCATRVVPFFGALQHRYLNLDFGVSFDSFDLTATVGGVRLKGKHPSKLFLAAEVFTGTIGGETGETAASQPPTETLPGYEMSCADALDPPPGGPCGGKEVSLEVARYLADLDDDGNADQVLDIEPSGAAGEEASLALSIEWAAEDAPVGDIPRSGFDEDGDGPDDPDPAPWCSVDPPGLPGDRWCLDTVTVTSSGEGQIQITETYRGTGDPRAFR